MINRMPNGKSGREVPVREFHVKSGMRGYGRDPVPATRGILQMSTGVPQPVIDRPQPVIDRPQPMIDLPQPPRAPAHSQQESRGLQVPVSAGAKGKTLYQPPRALYEHVPTAVVAESERRGQSVMRAKLQAKEIRKRPRDPSSPISADRLEESNGQGSEEILGTCIGESPDRIHIRKRNQKSQSSDTTVNQNGPLTPDVNSQEAMQVAKNNNPARADEANNSSGSGVCGEDVKPTVRVDELTGWPAPEDCKIVQSRIKTSAQICFPGWVLWKDVKKNQSAVLKYRFHVRDAFKNGMEIDSAFLDKQAASHLKARRCRWKALVSETYNPRTNSYTCPVQLIHNIDTYHAIVAELQAEEGTSVYTRSTQGFAASAASLRSRKPNVWGQGGYKAFEGKFMRMFGYKPRDFEMQFAKRWKPKELFRFVSCKIQGAEYFRDPSLKPREEYPSPDLDSFELPVTRNNSVLEGFGNDALSLDLESDPDLRELENDAELRDSGDDAHLGHSNDGTFRTSQTDANLGLSNDGTSRTVQTDASGEGDDGDVGDDAHDIDNHESWNYDTNGGQFSDASEDEDEDDDEEEGQKCGRLGNDGRGTFQITNYQKRMDKDEGQKSDGPGNDGRGTFQFKKYQKEMNKDGVQNSDGPGNDGRGTFQVKKYQKEMTKDGGQKSDGPGNDGRGTFQVKKYQKEMTKDEGQKSDGPGNDGRGTFQIKKYQKEMAEKLRSQTGGSGGKSSVHLFVNIPMDPQIPNGGRKGSAPHDAKFPYRKSRVASGRPLF